MSTQGEFEPNYKQQMIDTTSKKIQIQKLLDKHQQTEGELSEIQAKIEQKQIQYFSGTWNDGNYATGWHRLQPAQTKILLEVGPKDKKFSLSSVLSRASLQLGSIDNRKLSVFQKNRFTKKKKTKKCKLRGKMFKRRRPKRTKK